MGYPQFGIVKTIVLPLPETEITIDEYNNRYGIDLRSFVELSDSGDIGFKGGLPNSFILIDDINLLESNIRLNTVNRTSNKNYVEEVQDGVLGLVFVGDGESSGAIFELVIPKTAEFKIENIQVRNFEL